MTPFENWWRGGPPSAIFLDRDDTLSDVSNREHIGERTIRFLPRTREALTILSNLGARMFVITNQPGIAAGKISAADVLSVHARMNEYMRSWGLRGFDDIAFCPHAAEAGCACRKPKPQLIEQLADKWTVDRKTSVVVGDKISDAEAGLAAGTRACLVGGTYDPRFHTFPLLSDFAHWFHGVVRVGCG